MTGSLEKFHLFRRLHFLFAEWFCKRSILVGREKSGDSYASEHPIPMNHRVSANFANATKIPSSSRQLGVCIVEWGDRFSLLIISQPFCMLIIMPTYANFGQPVMRVRVCMSDLLSTQPLREHAHSTGINFLSVSIKAHPHLQPSTQPNPTTTTTSSKVAQQPHLKIHRLSVNIQHYGQSKPSKSNILTLWIQMYGYVNEVMTTATNDVHVCVCLHQRRVWHRRLRTNNLSLIIYKAVRNYVILIWD